MYSNISSKISIMSVRCGSARSITYGPQNIWGILNTRVVDMTAPNTLTKNRLLQEKNATILYHPVPAVVMSILLVF